MTAFTVSDDATGGSGGLSANAMALGADTNLIFTMTAPGQILNANQLSHDGLLTIARRMRFSKIATGLNAKVAATVIPTAEIVGNLKVQRGSQTAAQFNFSIPPSGQIPAPTGVATLAKDAASSVVKDVAKKWRFAGVRRDASGETTLGTVGAEIWMGEGSTRINPTFELFFDSRPGFNTTDSGVGIEITVVPYDKLADKEAAPTNINLSWSMGPFTLDSAFGANANAASGNLPVGTVINFQKVVTFGDGSMITTGPQTSHTIDASGGCSFNPGGGGTYLASGNTSVFTGQGILYKLSTHSGWTFAQYNQNIIIANTFADGGVALPGNSRTFSACAYAQLNLGMVLPFYGPDFANRFDLKVFCGGRQVAGTGAQYDGTGGSWPFPLNYTIAPGATTFTGTPYMNVFDPYGDEHLNYNTGSPRGDQYFVNGEKNAVDVQVPSRFGVTGLKLYASTAAADPTTGAVSGNWGAWQLVYDGPYIANFRWLGNILNASPTIPSANTTANYALLAGSVAWDASDAPEIIVEPGDQLIAQVTAGDFGNNDWYTKVQLSMPVEFIG